MKIYKVQVRDKNLYDEETWKIFESFIAVGNRKEIDNPDKFLPDGFTDEDIHFYFNSKELPRKLFVGDGVETDEFEYIILGSPDRHCIIKWKKG